MNPFNSIGQMESISIKFEESYKTRNCIYQWLQMDVENSEAIAMKPRNVTFDFSLYNPAK